VAELRRLVARIRAAFPHFAFDRAVLNDEGDDHAVVVLDEAWLFRFPRHARCQRRRFPVELIVLVAVGGA